MIKRIIFDIDNTLITGVDFFPVIKKSLEKCGITDIKKVQIFYDNIEAYEKKYGCYDKKLYLDFFSKKLGVSLDEKFFDYHFEGLKKAISNNSKELYEMLSRLSNYELVLLSNYFEESQRGRLKEMGINDFFISYYGEKITKPHKEAYIEALGDNKPSECVIVGDNKELDIDIPKSLGLKTIYVNKNGDIDDVCKITDELIKSLD